MSEKKDLYAVLNVSRDAGAEDIRRAYRRAAMQYHPDKSGDPTGAKFKEATEAYDVLSDPEKRAKYDKTGAYTSVERSEADWVEVLRQTLGGFADQLHDMVTGKTCDFLLSLLSKPPGRKSGEHLVFSLSPDQLNMRIEPEMKSLVLAMGIIDRRHMSEAFYMAPPLEGSGKNLYVHKSVANLILAFQQAQEGILRSTASRGEIWKPVGEGRVEGTLNAVVTGLTPDKIEALNSAAKTLPGMRRSFNAADFIRKALSDILLDEYEGITAQYREDINQVVVNLSEAQYQSLVQRAQAMPAQHKLT